MKRSIIFFSILIVLMFLAGCQDDNVDIFDIKASEIEAEKHYGKIVLESNVDSTAENRIVLVVENGYFPNYLQGEVVITKDQYGHFLLTYSNGNELEGDLVNLENDEHVICAELLNAKNQCVITMDYTILSETEMKNYESSYPHKSYAAEMLNSDEGIKSIKSNDKLIIGVVDTGVDYYHSYLKDFVSYDKGYDFVNGNNNVFDNYKDFHATAVDGTIIDVLAGGGYYNFEIINYKALEYGWGTDYSCAIAIKQAVDDGCDIINCSFGSAFSSDLIRIAVDYAYEKGVIVIAAAGNEYSNELSYPAKYENVISAGSINKNYVKSIFSNKGCDYVLPGEDVIAAYPNDSWINVDGTSFSSPNLVAVASIIMLQEGNCSVEELRDKITSISVDLGDVGYDKSYGYGVPVFEDYKVPIEEPSKEPITEPAPEPEKPTPEPTPEPEKPTPEPTPEPEKPTPEPTPEPEKPTLEPVPEPVPEPEKPTPAPEDPKKVYIVTFDANGGKVGKNKIEVENGKKYGDLPIPSRDYYTFMGWYTSKTGGEKITASTTVKLSDNQTLYARWSANTESEWVEVSKVPTGAKIVNRKYKYVLTSYTTSKNKELAGWMLYDTKWKWGNYGEWSEWSTTPTTDSNSRKVETKIEEYTYNTGRTLYNYSHYRYFNTTYNTWYYTYSYAAAAANGVNITYHELGWSTVEQFLYTKFGNSEQSWGTYINGYPYFNEVTKPETAIGTKIYYRYSDRVKEYTYYFKKSETKETKTNPSGKDNVSDIVEYVKYIKK